MAFTLQAIVPWGRSYEEYVKMFGLTRAELGLRILGCGDGPAEFNATLTRKGGNVVSIDPIYLFDAAQIRRRIDQTYKKIMAQMRENESDYVWDVISSVEDLGHVRMSAMNNFLADFAVGKTEGRYVAGELPSLPFADGAFQIALSSHFLFLYSRRLSLKFHLQALQEMLRVAAEVRVFPLLTLDGNRSPYVNSVVERLTDFGFGCEYRRVHYEFQRGGNEMLLIRKSV